MAGLVALALLPLAAYGASSFPPVSTNCTEAASKAVSWTVRNFTFDADTRFDYGPGTAGKVSFSIKNSANGYDFTCVQGDGSTGRFVNRFLVDGKVWYSCNVFCKGAKGRPNEDDPPLETSFHFDPETKALSLSQTWGCGTAPTNYTGTGSAVVSSRACAAIPGGRPEQVSCSSVDVTVKASNVSLAVETANTEDQQPDVDAYQGSSGGADAPSPFLPPVIPVPAVRPSTPGCSKLSQTPSWSISNILWSRGGINFMLKTSSLNYTQRCSIQGISQTLKSPSWWNCSRFDNMHVNYPSNEVFTSIYYGGPKNILGVNQTWYCADEDAAKPTVYSLYGEVTFPIKCRAAKYCIPPSQFDFDDKPEAVVNEACKADDLTIMPSKTDKYQVSKAEALQAFQPRGYNCTAKSLGEGGVNRTWDVTAITISRTVIPANPATNFTGGHSDDVEFWYNNTATDNDWPRNTGWRQCLYNSDTFDGLEGLTGTKRVSCGLSFEPFRMGFSFDNKTSTITFNQAWTCDGTDAQHSNYFVASGSAKLSLDCKSAGLVTKCKSESRLTVPMANITSTLNTNMSTPYIYVPGRD